MLNEMFDDVKRMDKRQFFYQVLSFGMIVSSALMIWKGLMVVTGSESPIVVVLSGSMEPAFHRGDLLFLTNYEHEDIRVGEIVVFKVVPAINFPGCPFYKYWFIFDISGRRSRHSNRT